MAATCQVPKLQVFLLFTLGADGLLRGSRKKKGEPEVGSREPSPGGALHPFQGAAWKAPLWGRCGCYMASFSLCEHLLSFISVSWMYRTTLVSVRRETP